MDQTLWRQNFGMDMHGMLFINNWYRKKSTGIPSDLVYCFFPSQNTEFIWRKLVHHKGSRLTGEQPNTKQQTKVRWLVWAVGTPSWHFPVLGCFPRGLDWLMLPVGLVELYLNEYLFCHCDVLFLYWCIVLLGAIIFYYRQKIIMNV